MRMEASIAQFLLDPVIRSRVKSIIEPWMFETEVYRAFSLSIIEDQFDKNELDFNILKAVIGSNYPNLRDPDFMEIDRLISDFNEVEEDDQRFILNIITDFFKKKTYAKGLQYIAEDDLDLAEDYLSRATNLNLCQREYTQLSNRGKLVDLLERKFPKDGQYIKSSFGLINDNSTYKGPRRGDLVQIVSPTGRGKTSLMCQEAATYAHQGFKVGYAVIGDNEEDDVAIKICAYYSRTPIGDVVNNFDEHLEKYSEYLDHIFSIAYPMYSVTVKEILSDFSNLKRKEGLDILFIDYDQNIAMAHTGMYESGGIIYGALKAFAQIEDCVVFVASQPKLHAWDQEIIGVKDANESAKKQANVDMMVTFNWNNECQKVGTMHLAKLRRGNTGAISRVKFNHHISELKEITQEEYDSVIASYKSRREGTELQLTDQELRFEDSNG